VQIKKKKLHTHFPVSNVSGGILKCKFRQIQSGVQKSETLKIKIIEKAYILKGFEKT